MVLLAVQFLHALAQGMAIVVLPWIVLARGAAVSSAGLVLTASFFPFILLGLPAGAAGDSGPRRRMLGWVLSAQAVVAATLLTAGPPGSLPLWAILGAAFLLGSGRVFVDAAMFGALGHLVPRDGMLSAQAAVSSYQLSLSARRVDRRGRAAMRETAANLSSGRARHPCPSRHERPMLRCAR